MLDSFGLYRLRSATSGDGGLFIGQFLLFEGPRSRSGAEFIVVAALTVASFAVTPVACFIILSASNFVLFLH